MICWDCKKNKKLKHFGKVSRQCKSCRKAWYLENKQKVLAHIKSYYTKNKEKVCNRQANYIKTHRWIKTRDFIYARCNNKNHKNFKYYGGRGIKCLISSSELKILWFRDKAYLMKKPSIHRKDNNKNYTFKNCQYIELVDNIKEANKRRSTK